VSEGEDHTLHRELGAIKKQLHDGEKRMQAIERSLGEVTTLIAEIKELLDAARFAKTATRLVKWFAPVVAGAVAVWAFFHGGSK
jgi:prefoldin subunit 5